jgi:FtsH-binding integral membrane protein
MSLVLAQMLLAHGGIPGLIGETASVFVALGVFGYFIRRSAKKERERERDS